MQTFMLVYNVSLTVLLSMALGSAWLLERYTGAKVFAAVCVILTVYIIDNTIIFCTENIAEFGLIYDRVFLSTPSVKTVSYLIIMGCVIYCACAVFKPESTRPFFITFACYAFALICIPLIQSSSWMVFLYYLANQVLIGGLCVWAMRRAKPLWERGTGALWPSYPMVRGLLIFTLFACAGVIIEDAVVIFRYDIFLESALKINNRNFCENFLFIGFSLFIMRYAQTVFSDVRSRADITSPAIEDALPKPRAAAADGAGTDDGNSALKNFCAAYGLTERECQILNRLFDGKGQQEISDELIIAAGTVKTHIHNIYQKLDVGKKGELWNRFREFKEGFENSRPGE